MSAFGDVVDRLRAGRSLDQVALDLALPRDLVRTMADHAARVGQLALAAAPGGAAAGRAAVSEPRCASGACPPLARLACRACPLA